MYRTYTYHNLHGKVVSSIQWDRFLRDEMPLSRIHSLTHAHKTAPIHHHAIAPYPAGSPPPFSSTRHRAYLQTRLPWRFAHQTASSMKGKSSCQQSGATFHKK